MSQAVPSARADHASYAGDDLDIVIVSQMSDKGRSQSGPCQLHRAFGFGRNSPDNEAQTHSRVGQLVEQQLEVSPPNETVAGFSSNKRKHASNYPLLALTFHSACNSGQYSCNLLLAR